MRLLAIGLLMLAACDRAADQPTRAKPTAITYDGGDYTTAAAKVAHGKRLSQIFTCSGCHGADYSGVNFGAMIPIVEGLWAPNISLGMKAMSDSELERVLRKGVTPSRDEIYVMPSKQTQFLTELDMAALIAYLRTIPAKGKPPRRRRPTSRTGWCRACRLIIGDGSCRARNATIIMRRRKPLTLRPINRRSSARAPNLIEDAMSPLRCAQAVMERLSTEKARMRVGSRPPRSIATHNSIAC